MAVGEWLSVQSSRELYKHEIAIEARELADDPKGEALELTAIYEAKGLPHGQAEHLATRLMADSGNALDTHVREELGIDPKELGGSAWVAAGTSFVLFAGGAIVPVAPYLIFSGADAVITSLIASAIGLFALGAGITLMTGRNPLFSGTRQVIFGMAAAALTFGIGRLIGATIAG